MSARRRWPLSGVLGAALLIGIVLAGVVIPIVWPFGPTQDTGTALAAPSWQHLFGTDNLGRDVFVRVFAAARIDIGLALIGVAAPFVIGTTIGTVAAISDIRLLQRVVNLTVAALNAFPNLVLLLAVIAVLGAGPIGIIIALIVGSWARYATLASARTSAVRGADYISALSVLGYRRPRIVFRHVVPNVVGGSVAYAVSDFTFVILAIGTLSFLGAGVQPPTPEWGAMIADGRLYLLPAPWMTWGPGLVLTVTGFAAALVGESWKARNHGR